MSVLALFLCWKKSFWCNHFCVS